MATPIHSLQTSGFDGKAEKLVRIWEVVYPDFRTESGFSSALFSFEGSATAFASHYSTARVTDRWITMTEFSSLRRQHRL